MIGDNAAFTTAVDVRSNSLGSADISEERDTCSNFFLRILPARTSFLGFRYECRKLMAIASIFRKLRSKTIFSSALGFTALITFPSGPMRSSTS